MQKNSMSITQRLGKKQKWCYSLGYAIYTNKPIECHCKIDLGFVYQLLCLAQMTTHV